MMVVPRWYLVVFVHCQYESGFYCCVGIDIACAITVVHIIDFELLSWLWQY